MYNSKKCISLQFLLTISICLRTSRAQSEAITAPEVTILQGKLQGSTLTTNQGKNFSGFLGIPYAQPPVGNLRFANPMPAESWNGTRDATIDMNVCPQSFRGTEISGDEDCLFLNVYTPQLPENLNASLLPVMVYIHGGGFTSGSGRFDRRDPSYFLDKDIVFVSPNYRIGALGFLSTGDEVASGNWALKDQALALKWVQDNIEYFGGDPGRVTIFGESAGSVSVSLLALSNLTKGLFHRYITQSGSAFALWAHQPRAYYASRAFQLGQFVGCSNDTSDALIHCLRKIDFADLLSAQSQFLVWNRYPTIVWTPTDEPDIEGAALTDSPTNLFAKNGAHDLPCISGVVSHEGLMLTLDFHEDQNLFEDFLENIDLILPEFLTITYQSDAGAAWVSAIKSYYFNNDLTTNRSLLLTNLTTLITDALFHYPAYNALRLQSNVLANPQYFYTFNYRGTYSYTFFYADNLKNYGVIHGDECIYLYPLSATLANYNKTFNENDLKIVDTMVQLWTSFAVNGTPTYSGFNDTVKWQPYSTENNYIRIGNDSDAQIEVESSLLAERLQFWDNLMTSASAATVNSNLLIIVPFICSVLVVSA